MVFLTRFLDYPKKIPRKYLRKGFLDALKLRVQAGKGGTGQPRYGGVGGRGGNVVMIATEDLSLHHIAEKWRKRKIQAENGGDSHARGLIGIHGEDIEVPVPLGVTVYDENRIMIGEIDKKNSRLIVARGGIGGCQQTGFSGQEGQNHVVTLDLKLIADVGLVGFPNAGKSTLLSRISNAKPKIADYPFTTVRPNLGIVHYPDLRRISVADLPGLIEGAHVNIGMGHKFLKHLDRTKVILFLVDIQGFRLSPMHKFRTCLETIVLLNKELELYNPDLLDMHSMLMINKMDSPDAEKKFQEIEPALKDLQTVMNEMSEEIRPEKTLHFNEIITTSLINKDPEEIARIKERIRDNLDQQAAAQLAQSEDEVKLFNKLSRELRIETPTLI